MTKVSEEKLVLECDIRSLEGFEKDKASLQALSIPEMSQRQPDLMYMIDIMVSTGANLNGAYFLPSEIYKARNTIMGKAVDILHEEEQVVGHITGYSFLDKNGSILDIENLRASSGDNFDNESFDVATSSVIYKLRFPEIADRIESRHFKVSMECFYRNIDVKVGNLIISAEEAMKAGLIEMVGNKVQVVDGRKKDVVPVYRVLRDILFSGKGLVDKPANPDSLILEAASIIDEKNLPIINLMEIESYRKKKQEEGRIEILSTTNKESAVGLGRSSPLTTVSKTEHENQCVSFARHYTPGIDESNRSYVNNPESAKENYCKLFDMDCPVAGYSSDYACWRNVFNRTSREIVQNELDALVMLRKNLGVGDGLCEEEVDSEEMSMEAAIESASALLVSIDEKIKKADDYLHKNSDRVKESFDAEYLKDEESEAKSRKSINALPDSSFAYVEHGPDGQKHGYLPHHTSKGGGTSNVNLDMAHLRNAFARVNQVKPKFGSISKEALVAKCKAHLNHHRSALKGGDDSKSSE